MVAVSKLVISSSSSPRDWPDAAAAPTVAPRAAPDESTRRRGTGLNVIGSKKPSAVSDVVHHCALPGRSGARGEGGRGRMARASRPKRGQQPGSTADELDILNEVGTALWDGNQLRRA